MKSSEEGLFMESLMADFFFYEMFVGFFFFFFFFFFFQFSCVKAKLVIKQIRIKKMMVWMLVMVSSMITQDIEDPKIN